MKEVVLSKNLGYLQIDTSAVAGAIGPTSYDMGTWEDGATNVFIMQEEIDVSGLTQMEFTFYPIAGDVQRGPTSMGLAFATGGYINEWIYVCASPIRPNVGSQFQTWNLVGQGAMATEFQNVIWGKSWTWATNTSIPANWAVAINTTLMGSGEPTNGDRLYVYRVVSIAGFTPGVGTFAELPSVRLLLSGQLREEADYAQLMRMRRTYQLQQFHDED